MGLALLALGLPGTEDVDVGVGVVAAGLTSELRLGGPVPSRSVRRRAGAENVAGVDVR
ncbi:MAG: hypothetical protein ACRDZ8_00825 [Acidimicrobiales bacterium]